MIQTDEAFTVEGRKHTQPHTDTHTQARAREYHQVKSIPKRVKTSLTRVYTSLTRVSKGLKRINTSQLDYYVYLLFRIKIRIKRESETSYRNIESQAKFCRIMFLF